MAYSGHILDEGLKGRFRLEIRRIAEKGPTRSKLDRELCQLMARATYAHLWNHDPMPEPKPKD